MLISITASFLAFLDEVRQPYWFQYYLFYLAETLLSFTADCKVLEITVGIVTMGTPEQLYEVSGEVYMRLDGSLHGPLKPSEIQEWAKQVLYKVLKLQRCSV